MSQGPPSGRPIRRKEAGSGPASAAWKESPSPHA